MASEPTLWDVVRSELPEAMVAGANGTELEAQLVAIVSAAEAAWPMIRQPREIFARYLAERVARDQPLAAALAHLRAGDLYLACACARGDARALAAFEERHFANVDGALRHMRLVPALADEIKQQLRCQLFVADADTLPMIVDYRGRGDLKSWVRSVAVHAALKRLEAEHKHVPLDDRLAHALPSEDDDPQLSHLKDRYAGEFRRVLAQALQSLSRRERNLVRQHFIDGLTIDELAPLYRVHRATAARWLVSVRETLLERTRRQLIEELNLLPHELDSLTRLVRSQLDISLHRVLKRAT